MMYKKSLGVASLLVVSVILFGSIAFADIISGISTTNVSNDVTLTQLTLSKPAGTALGDVLLANVSVNGGTPAEITGPTGWVFIARTDNDTNISIASYYKIVGSSEPISYVWNISPQTHAVGGITRYTGIDLSNPIDTFGTSTGRSATATAPSITVTGAGDQVVALFATNEGKNNSPFFSTTTGMSKKYDAKNAPFGPTTAVEDKTQATSGTVGSSSVTVSNNKDRDWAAQTIALRMNAGITEDFESYAVGSAVSGQNGGSKWSGPWGGNVSFVMENTDVHIGAQSLEINFNGGPQQTIQRTFASKTQGTLHWAQRKSTDSHSMYVVLSSGTNTWATDVGIETASQGCGGWDMLTDTGGHCIASYSLGDWNSVDLQFNTVTEQYRVSVNGGAYTSWQNFMTPVASIDTLLIYAASSGSNSIGNWDDISITGQ